MNVLQRNNVRITGNGTQPMLFAHGFGCDQSMWRFVAPQFEKDYKVILFDYVGSGKSDLSLYSKSKYSTLEGYAQDILDICEALDLSDVVFVGHSVSSMIGILAANKRPELFSELILIGPSPSYINDDTYVGGFEKKDIEGLLDLMEHNFIGWANLLAPVIMKNPERGELATELEESFCSTDLEISKQFAKVTFLSDYRSALTDVTVPTLIIQVADDAIAPVAVGEYMNERLEQSTYSLLDATGHCPHMSHPQETVDAIRAYLSREHRVAIGRAAKDSVV